MPKFCPTCGNSSDKIAFLGNFCMNCAKERFNKSLDITAEVLLCKKCGKIKSGKGQSYEEISGKSLESAISQHFRRYNCHLIDYTDKTARLDISDETEHGKLSVEHEVEIEFKRKMCDMC
ncbi:60S ribosomal export protein NMD3 [Candidatus Marsarchaeota archaeon]|nr:60S ribosomal export protein NMD3 [Candidatus Marsarchaeota archaeon]